MAKVWVGVDVGKAAHHVAAVNAQGRCLLSRRVVNDELDIATVVSEVKALGTIVCWAVDVTTGLTALLLTILRQHRFEVRYVSGLVEHHMASTFASEHKTDARDAAVIAHTARLRPELPLVLESDELLMELRLLMHPSC
jgi:transposase